MTAASKGPVAEWTVREQLILASAVQRSGDQNWVSVSRAIKPLMEDARPAEHFSQKNCALQYSSMLDKAKHPKRKRSSDTAPESGTVEEQIVRQLTEKRMKELNTSMIETRKEYNALKKEMEQIERGELDGELVSMWEKAQAEMAVKEGSESKGSRARKSSLTSGSAADGDHSKRAKLAGAGASGSTEKKTHKSPEKRKLSLSSSHPVAEAPVSNTASGTPVKEEKMDVAPSSASSAETATSAPPPPPPPSATTHHPSPLTTTPTTPRSTSKKRNIENLTLNVSTTSSSGGGEVLLNDESPLPYPMTVPKEEQLQESLAASGGRLSRSLLHPLSPDMHIIVQQPNIAAISGGGDNTGSFSAGSGEKAAGDIPASSAPPPPVEIPCSTAPSTSSSVNQLEARSEAEGKEADVGSVVVKQEPQTVGPKTAAEAVSLYRQPPTVSKHPCPLPPTPPAPPSPTTTTATGPSPAPTSSKSTPLPPPSPSSKDRVTTTLPSSSTTATVSSPKQPHSHSVPPSSSTPLLHPPPTPRPTTVVSSVLSDPRLSSGNTRPGKAPSQQTAVTQVPTTADQTRAAIKTRTVLEPKTGGPTTAVSQTLAEKEQEAPGQQVARPGESAGSEGAELEMKTDMSEPSHPVTGEDARPATAIKKELLQALTPPPLTRPPLASSKTSPSGNVGTTTHMQEGKVAVVTEKESDGGRAGGVTVVVTPEKTPHIVMEEAASSVIPTPPPRVDRGPASGGGGEGGDGGEGEASEEASIRALVDEQVQMEAGSSRRSSTSELPSSPLTGGRDEAEAEEVISRKRLSVKSASSSKKLWPTRSRKRRLDQEEGMSTDMDSEEEPSSRFTSAAPSPAPSQGDGDQDGGMSKKQWKKAIMLVWRHAAQHKYANLFLHPVKDDDAPGYRDVIHRPMDLSSVKRNIETGVTTTDIEFQRDMLLMFQNAFMYNSSDHDVYEMAEKMRADVMQSIQDYLSTQLQLIVESSTPKVLRSRDREGRRGDTHEEGLTPVKKRRTRADDVC